MVKCNLAACFFNQAHSRYQRTAMNRFAVFDNLLICTVFSVLEKIRYAIGLTKSQLGLLDNRFVNHFSPYPVSPNSIPLENVDSASFAVFQVDRRRRKLIGLISTCADKSMRSLNPSETERKLSVCYGAFGKVHHDPRLSC